MTTTHDPERDVIVPRSIRYRWTREQAAAGLAACGLEPDGRLIKPLGDVADPSGALRDLVGPDGQLPPFAAEALAVVASPGRTIHALANAPGTESWVDILFGAAATEGPYVTVEATDDHVDLYAIETAMEVAAVLDELFRLTAYPARPVDPDVGLTLGAWLGLLALADVRRLHRLRDDLRRTRGEPGPLTVTDLDGALTVGLRSADSRWAVSAAVPTAPVVLRERRPSAERAFEEMTVLGLVSGDADAFMPTELGLHLVEAIEQTVVLGSITLTYRHHDREVRGGELVLYRSPTRLVVGIWSGTSEEPVVTLTEPTPEAAVAMIRRLVELPRRDESVAATPPAPPFDATHEVGPDGVEARVAPASEAAVDGRLPAAIRVRVLARREGWAEVVVESGARGWVPADSLRSLGGWAATHRVGEGGTSLRPDPDPAAAVIAALGEGVEVAVQEESGVWAHIRTDDGGEGWVDGRHLLSV